MSELPTAAYGTQIRFAYTKGFSDEPAKKHYMQYVDLKIDPVYSTRNWHTASATSGDVTRGYAAAIHRFFVRD
ncbi:hypothetical protein CBM2629_A60065 [Cupriavidus taiwanensis]|nr:hypothetical protein CBM2629_A60065 [Cupriavidus taiwanensis]